MGGKGSGKKRGDKAKDVAPPPLAPQGAGKKRTPQSLFDPAAGKDIYQPEQKLLACAALCTTIGVCVTCIAREEGQNRRIPPP